MLSFVVVWEGLQSEWFAKKVSSYATKYAKEILDTDIRFSSINFRIYPPGAELKNVQVMGEDDDFKFETKVSSLGFYFNPFDIFDTKFRVNRIVLKDGKLNFKLKDSNSTSKKSNEKPTPTKIFKKIEALPLNQIVLEDILVKYEESKLTVNNLYLFNNKTEIELNGSIRNIELGAFIPFDEPVDELYFKGVVNPHRLKIKKGHIKKDLAIVMFKGEVESYLSDNIKYNLRINASLPLKMAEDFVDISDAGRLYEGELNLDGSLIGEGNEIKGSIDGTLENFRTDFAYGHKLSTSLSFNSDRIRVKKFNLKANDQEVTLNKSFELFNLKSKKWIEEPVFATAKNFRSDNFLSILKGQIDFVDVGISGDIRFDLKNKFYTFSLGENTILHDLVLKPNGTQIFHLQNFSAQKGEFRIEDDIFTLDTVLTKGESRLPIKGIFGKDKLLLQMDKGRLNFSEMNPLLDFKVGGIGDLSFQLFEKNDLMLNVTIDAENFVFDNYYLDKVDTNLLLNLDKDKMEIKALIGKVGPMEIITEGVLDYGASTILADYQLRNISVNSLKKVLVRDADKIIFTEENLNGSWESGGTISGGTTLETMKVRGFLNGTNNYVFEENVEDIKLNYLLENNTVIVKDFVASKASGKVFSFLEYDIGQDKLSIWSKVSKVIVNELSVYSKVPLNLSGQINGELNVTHYKDRWTGDGSFKLSDTSVLSERYKDSDLKLVISDDYLELDLQALGQTVDIKSKLSIVDKNKLSSLDINLELPELRKFFGIFAGVDVLDTSLTGSLSYSANATFKLDPFKVYDLRTNLKEFILSKGQIDVDYKNPEAEIEVVGGNIKKWDTNLRGKNFYIISEGSGDLRGSHSVVTNLKVDASILEIFSDFIPKANGNLRGKFLYESGLLGDKYEALVTSNNLALSSNLLPTAITQTNMQLSFSKNNLNIDKFRAELVSGVMELSGGVNFNNVFPDVNVKYEFRDAGVAVMKKSNLIFSGSGSLVGKKFPYTLGGDIYIQRLIIVNEITEFSSGGSPVFADDIKYLPGREKIDIDYLIDLNLNISTREPIYVKNSMIDVGFVGGIQVVGSERDPRLIGKFSLAPRNNLVSFKNNNFSFSKGNVFFSQEDELTNPELDFLATTTINDYKIYAKLIGHVKNFDFTFTSEPALPQSDILSLVAFGYTDDVSSNLTDAEKESLTRASVGSLLFDGFKINETLKNEFGLQVNLGTQIIRDEANLISQRNAESNVQSTGVTSATTFEIKKQLSDAMTLSVSSTVGDTRNERQGVNLNYTVNKKVSVEGVYETNNIDEVQTINDTNSFGADLKVRWTFK